ncbi:MAG: S8 family serine peptidase [Bacteroidales bacterium]|nr:S8 family serine peptidase [Bacteroidales bacterium]
MKRTIAILAFALTVFSVSAQSTWWVFFADKAGSTFDPYSYFDAKAIERYRQCGADLYDITNYPVNADYEQGVATLATEEIGASRWMNALGIVATAEQIVAIERLPYVLRVQPIEADGMQYASADMEEEPLDGLFDVAYVDGPLTAQLVRMGGKDFHDKGIDGKGVRIAVFDGGFPQVNTHSAFKHLRDNHQILKTWNFPKKKEDVYGWNSHGTMTLSCIAGREGDRNLGLATGAEFLLARTEVNSEPFKEEVWWQMAVEWADKNGANIISSSLGYGKERHYTKDMDGTSYVAKAGNLAARKGILVCNSAGNEADDRQWKTIITPSDADSVLCIGGIENSLTEYNHIEFSSYGPSADGRLKPNVCAFGYARTANVGKGDNRYHYVHGTSFSCPLVAGFAACAWQASPGKTAMQMFDLIQRSADLYPYADYSFGYGVPQAAFFTGTKQPVAPTFRFEVDGENRIIHVKPNAIVMDKPIFFKEQSDNGHIYRYGKQQIDFIDTTGYISFGIQPNSVLVVHLDGYTDSISMDKGSRSSTSALGSGSFGEVHGHSHASNPSFRNPQSDNKPSLWGSNAKYRWDIYGQMGLNIATGNNEVDNNFFSPDYGFGVRFLLAFSKTYCLGVGIGFNIGYYRYNGREVNDIENSLNLPATQVEDDAVDTRRVKSSEFTVEFFQRVRLLPMGIFGHGLHWDLGIYGTHAGLSYRLSSEAPSAIAASHIDTRFEKPDVLSKHEWQFGVATRLTYDFIGIYARYRLNGIGSDPAAGKVFLPRLVVGLQLMF